MKTICTKAISFLLLCLFLLSAAVSASDARKTIYTAALSGDVDILESLIRNTPDIDAKDEDGYAAIHYAAMGSHEKAVDVLMRNGADVNIGDAAGRTSLEIAIVAGDTAMSEFLKSWGAYETSPLNDSMYSDFDLMKRLVEHGSNINFRPPDDGITPLSRAVLNRKNDIRDYLLTKGAEPDIFQVMLSGDTEEFIRRIGNLRDTNIRDADGCTLLLDVFVYLQPEVEKVTEEACWKWVDYPEIGENVKAVSNICSEEIYGPSDVSQNITPDEYLKFKRIVTALLERGAAPDAAILPAEDEWRVDAGKTPLHFVAYPGIAKLLLRHDADPNTRTFPAGLTPLHETENTAIAKLLLEHDADPNIQDANGNTPLHLNKPVDMVELLLKHSANPNIKNKEGEVPLHIYMASRDYYPDKNPLVLLIRNGADPFIEGPDGKSVIDYALNIRQELLTALMENGLNPNKRDANGDTFFHRIVATRAICHQFFKYDFDRYKIDVNARDHNGRTPLHIVLEGMNKSHRGFQSCPIIHDYMDFAELLIDRGADLSIRDSDGKTAQDLVLENNEPGRGYDVCGSVRIDDDGNYTYLVDERERKEFWKKFLKCSDTNENYD